MPDDLKEHINSELKSMDHRLSDLEDKITSIDGKITQVVDAILGNPLTKEGGLLNDITELKLANKSLRLEMEMLKEKVRKQEEFKSRVGWSIGVVVAIGLIIQFFSRLYSDIVK